MKQIVYVITLGLLVLGLSLVQVNAQQDVHELSEQDVQHVTGSWHGTVRLLGKTFITRVYITAEDGKLRGRLDDLTSGKLRIPLKEITVDGFTDGSTISFTVKPPFETTATFEGTMDGQTMTGTVKQLVFRGSFKLTNVSMPDATQGESELSIKTEAGTVYGTLVMPDLTPPVPIAVIIAGSGPTDRDGNAAFLAGRNDNLKLLSQELRSMGVASLRYDKRGVGKSSGAFTPEADLRFEDYVADVEQWIALMEADSRFNAIVLIGHSQGALIGMIAATRYEVDALISIAGVGRPIYGVLEEQIQRQVPGKLDEAQKIIAELKAGRQVPKVSRKLQSLFRPSVQPFLISWFAYDPQEIIRKVTCPVLLVQGDNDLQVSVQEAELLRQARPDAKLLLVSGMNHVMKMISDDKQDNIDSYSNPELPLSPEMLEGLQQFIEDIRRVLQ